MLSRSRKPLLIVPIRDRRQRRRILTIRNCAISMLSFAVIFAAISIYNEARRTPAGEYGRLFGSQVPATNTAISRNVDVIKEGAIDDQRAADPMLVAPAAREQILLADTNVPAPPPQPVAVPVAPPSAIGNVSGHGTTIVGDGNGVAIVRASATSTAPRPVLSGGIFKQQ
ncbi:MAG TPA: hypothetical protein VHY33_03140 [Thermoanaerobaculia bacterium]|jgi:hypothetical protein|nr:hypothetical protein [Thermoanaerobaculia bacterium]